MPGEKLFGGKLKILDFAWGELSLDDTMNGYDLSSAKHLKESEILNIFYLKAFVIINDSVGKIFFYFLNKITLRA